MSSYESDNDRTDGPTDDYPWRDSDRLRQLYHGEQLSTYDIAEKFGCSHSTVSRWMRKHGIERRRHPNETPLEERFWSKVDRGSPDECWEWTGVRTGGGYGQIGVEGDQCYAHRVAYALEIEDPGDDFVLHHCDNRSCVNTTHLYLGDQSDNMQDAYKRERASVFENGEANPNTDLTREEIGRIHSRHRRGETQVALATEYGVGQSTISRIVRGEVWVDE